MKQPVLAIEASPVSQMEKTEIVTTHERTTIAMTAQDRVNAIKASLQRDQNLSTVSYY